MASVDTLVRIEGSIQDGGWSAGGVVFNDADVLDFYQGIDAWVDAYVNGAWEGSPRPAFRGHLLPDPWRKTFQSSEAPFSSFIANEFMKRGQIQGIFYKDVAGSPGNRHQIINMSYAKIIYEIISGHCNLMHEDEASNYDSSLWSGSFTTTTHPEGFLRLDIDTANSTAVDEYEVKQGNFWARMREIADIEFYQLYVDKSNTLHYVPHPMFGASLPPVVKTITSDLLLEPLTIDRRNTEQIGQVKLQGTTPRGLQISGKHPTDANPGPIILRAGYVATSNSLMNTIAERIYKFENRDFTVTAKMAGAIGLLFDLNDRVEITYTSSVDGITWSQKKFWVSKVSVEIGKSFNAVSTVTLDAENP